MKLSRSDTIFIGIFWALGSQAHAVAVSAQGTWESTLLGRDLDGNPETFEAYYDTSLNITWLADANYAKTSGFSTRNPKGYINWPDAVIWAATVEIGGVTGWRLPSAGADPSVPNEMLELDTVTLANPKGCFPSPNNCVFNTGPFTNLLRVGYWTGTEWVRTEPEGRGFDALGYWFGSGGQGYTRGSHLAWLVHDGDVCPTVPVPAAIWLFGSGVAGLTGVAMRKKRVSLPAC